MIALPRISVESTSKARQVEDFIRRMIESGEIKPGDQLPSEIEIARQMGVYRLTVNKAMGNLVSSGHLYRLQGKGTFVADREGAKREGLRSAKLKLAFILFIGRTADASNVYLTSPYHALCNHLGSSDIIVKSFQVDELSACEPLLERRPDICVIFTFRPLDAAALSLFERAGVPAILFNSRVEGIPSVNTDNEESTRRLTEALVAKGHRCIPMLYFDNGSSVLRERLSGYGKAMERHSLLPLPVPLSGWLADSGMEALSKLAAAKLDFDAVICEGAGLLQGARKWLDGERRPGAAPILACLDNWGGALGFESPAELYIETPLMEMGVRAGELLAAVVEGNDIETADVVVPAKIVDRQPMETLK